MTKTIHPEGWAPALGYANGMLMDDGTLHIGGQIGWDKNKRFVQGGFVPQMEQALSNIAAIVRAAGGEIKVLPFIGRRFDFFYHACADRRVF